VKREEDLSDKTFSEAFAMKKLLTRSVFVRGLLVAAIHSVGQDQPRLAREAFGF
jgi:hypothetical protein